MSVVGADPRVRPSGETHVGHRDFHSEASDGSDVLACAITPGSTGILPVPDRALPKFLDFVKDGRGAARLTRRAPRSLFGKPG